MPEVPEATMSEPMVLCMIPYRERPDFVQRAIRCYDAQTYTMRHLVLLDNGKEPNVERSDVGGYSYIYRLGLPNVGAIRNYINGLKWPKVPMDCEYIAHFDFDDISAPNRLQCQLDHINKTGKQVTGFWDCPQYDLKRDKVWIYENPRPGQYALGNGLLYRRSTWERVKFPEDRAVDDPLRKKNVGGENIETRSVWENGKPLMIQVVHGANTSATIIRSSTHYKEPTTEQEKAVRKLLMEA